MSKLLIHSSLLAVLGIPSLLTATVVGAEPAADVETVRSCMKANLPTQSFVQEILLHAVDRGGSERKLDAKISWRLDEDKRVQANIRIDAPPDLSGSSYLLLEKESRDDLYMYLPSTQRSRRIVGGMMSQPVWGTDLSYEDVKRLQGVMDDGQVERLEDAQVNGRAVYQLRLTPTAVEESPYRTMVMSIDKDTCVILQGEFFEAGEEPVKRLEADPAELKQEGEKWYPAFIRLTDLRDDSFTTLTVQKITLDPDLPSRLFSPRSFYRGN